MTTEMIQLADSVIVQTYKRYPVVFQQGQGCQLMDTQGRTYTDFIAGIAVCNLGHAHPRIARALWEQAQKLFHVSNLYYTLPQTQLARRLVEISFADRVFFCNSGAEANEAAIKLARKYFSEKGQPHRFRIVSMRQSFHGRTMATLSATGQEKIQKGFAPVLDGFDFVPFNDAQAIENAIGPATCAVMLEPIQGEGGVVCPDPDYLKQVRAICDQAGILMILDEIQTGMGRTGTMFAYEQSGIAPDIMTLAKALGNGLPIGAMLAKEQVASAFGYGAHASTFGGTPIITAAALEVLNVFRDDHIVEKCRETGAYFKEKLEWLKNRHESVLDVRGTGLLLGIRLDRDGLPITMACMEKGFLINCVQDTILRFAPPLIIQKQDIDALVACLDEILDNV